ncbi:MAG TPA: hypothetical protein VFG14_17905 [Chthoniobacteraceae bacterium]|jgi:hypothetical protein|nr:hypothetical protein [Chthoniobacteraceae bacterium]
MSGESPVHITDSGERFIGRGSAIAWLVVIACVVIPVGLFLFHAFRAAGEGKSKVAAFKALDESKFRELIVISQELASTVQPNEILRFGRTGDKPQMPIPDRFAAFGFEGLTVRSNEVEGLLYYVVDSGASVKVTLGPSPTISVIEGEPAKTTIIYP